MAKYLITTLIIIAAFASWIFLSGKNDVGNNLSQNNLIENNMPKKEETTPKEKIKIAVIETDYGVIEFELYEKDAPKTTASSISLVNKKFYDGIIFHRIIKSFMIQGGDPLGNGTGGPGYKFEDELNQNTQS